MPEFSPQIPRVWNVLLVEDEPAVLQMLKGMLEHDGLSVTAAESGEDALVRLRECAFDLLVTDKNLPGPDGVDLARWARERHPRIGIIMMTGYASVESAQAMLGVVDEYFTKPFDLRAFRKALKSVLERRAQAMTAESEGEEAARQGHRVLLVQPEERLRLRLKTLLDALGFEVQCCEATDLEQPADGLVIDTAVCGTEAVRAVWRQKAGPRDFPVVAFSRSSSLDGSTRAISLMARAHLVCTESDQNILDTLRRALTETEPLETRSTLSAAS